MDLGQRMAFYFQKTWIKLAIQRGIQFEIVYAPACLEVPSQRKNFLLNAMALIKLTKGKNIILGSEAASVLYQRSPLDCMSMAKMLGIVNAQDAIATVKGNCRSAMQHAHYRKTFRGVAEVVEAEMDS